MNTDKALSVSQLNRYIKLLMERDDMLGSVAVTGEISNFKYHTSGHMYFTLKDGESEISAVMFRAAVARLNFKPRNGLRVVAYGRVSVYEASGKYQVYVSAMTDGGAGALYAEYMRLLEKLRSEGLFEADRKKPLPSFPRRVGIVTSPTGAAIRDMINVTGRRYPLADIVVCPSAVQGTEAPSELRAALELLDAAGDCDVIIIGRGGGSAEDLWAFNDEGLVRAVAACSTPVISAVGHETDTTLCDFAADMRAPTPSAAAELAVPDRYTLLQRMDETAARLTRAMDKAIEAYVSRLGALSLRLEAASPTARLETARLRTLRGKDALDAAILGVLQRSELRLSAAAGRLEAVSPLAVLSRGYGMVRDGGGGVIKTVSGLKKGDAISVTVSDGHIDAVVSDTRREEIR